MSKKNLVAVYGSLRKNMGNHGLLENAEYLGEFTTEPIYNLHSLGGFPGLKKGGNTAVVMEVYEVDEPTARRVDALEGYDPNSNDNTFYDKEMIETPYGEAGVYFYVRDLRPESIVESGDWRQFREQRIKSFSPRMN